MEFLRSFPRLHFAGKKVATSRNAGCFLKLKSMFIQSVLGVNRKYYGQDQNSESAILRLRVRLGRFCSELHYGAFLVQNRSLFWLLPSCAGHWDRQKRKKTKYLSHKNPFNGLTIIFNAMKFLILVIFLSTCDYDCSLLSHFWVYTVFFQVFTLVRFLLRHLFVARNAVTNHKRPWEGERRKPSPSHLSLRAYFYGERVVWIRGRYFHVLC